MNYFFTNEEKIEVKVQQRERKAFLEENEN
jgi:hypothetical protein